MRKRGIFPQPRNEMDKQAMKNKMNLMQALAPATVPQYFRHAREIFTQ